MVSRAGGKGGWYVKKWRDVGQRAQSCSYKMSKF